MAVIPFHYPEATVNRSVWSVTETLTTDGRVEFKINATDAPPKLPDKPLLFVPCTEDILRAHGAHGGRKQRRRGVV
jgi:hypothetical protein